MPLPPGFVSPCLPTKASTPPTGEAWLHEIKHDGFRLKPYSGPLKMIRTILCAALIVLTVPAKAETPAQWIELGARVHGAFGAFIPIGIRIGLDANERIKADRRGLTVTYYIGDKAPCPCIADGVMLATDASPGQGTLVIAQEKAPTGALAVVVVRDRKTGEGFRYTVGRCVDAEDHRVEQEPRSCWTLRCSDEGRRLIRDRFGSRTQVGERDGAGLIFLQLNCRGYDCGSGVAAHPFRVSGLSRRPQVAIRRR
jgi:FmdE, Molybdenum formylmethanofuran dehydrogenase operon